MGNQTINSTRSLQDDELFSDLVKQDLNHLIGSIEIDLEELIFKLGLYPQSICGRAQNGHGEIFRGRKYVQTTIPDVIVAAGLDLHKIKTHRQDTYEGVAKLITDLLDEKKVTRFVQDGKPLLGVGFLRDYKINDPTAVLKGMVLAGHMDSFDFRLKTMNFFNYKTIDGSRLNIAGGENYLIDLSLLSMLGLNINNLGEKAHTEEEINYLKSLDVVHDKGISGRELESAYIRRREGGGTCDDMALIMIGQIYGIDAMYGAFLIDAIDTYDKCVLYPEAGGLDEKLAKYIQSSWVQKTGKPLVSDEEIYQLIYHAAKGNTPKVRGSSSHRRFIQYEGENIKRQTFLHHRAHVEGEATDFFQVGFGGFDSPKFYEIADIRARHYESSMAEIEKKK